ncbi:MAG: chlorite dismutase family protein [Nitrospinae bacterium]|nr:chlorite dismutase family protein [Nitrospinota bacterium]
MSEHKPAGHPGGHPGGKPGGHPGDSFDAEAVTDITEKGRDGQRSDRRLFVQLLAFDGCDDEGALVEALKASGMEAVLYANVANPTGVALVTMTEDPAFFTETLRPFLRSGPFAHLILDPAFTMMGRTYSLGHEENLEDWLLTHTRRVSRNPAWPWAVWYPLRRKGEFARLEPMKQGMILMEHGLIGRAFGSKDYAHDIRLSCVGMDTNDNDFVVGLTGKDLFPLAKVVEAMRKTVQTSTYLENLGPFFIGRAIYQKPLA